MVWIRTGACTGLWAKELNQRVALILSDAGQWSGFSAVGAVVGHQSICLLFGSTAIVFSCEGFFLTLQGAHHPPQREVIVLGMDEPGP